jgi:hypothetical protein
MLKKLAVHLAITVLTGGALAGSALAQARGALAYAPTASCNASKSTLDGWFSGGTITKNGMVNAANGAAFPPRQNTACDFYKWGAQMFLWLTSPTNGVRVFDGPLFFDIVSGTDPKDPKLTLKFQPNTGANNNAFAVRSVKPIDATSVAQAGGGGVLVSQSGALTFYGIHANDVYAYYRTAQYDKKLSGSLTNNFPTSAADVAAVAKAVGKTFADANALSLELKTSWVPVSAVQDATRYVVINAVVPTYTKNKANTVWTETGTATQALALVGFHVVGTVNGHPEMVWATFEHADNAPDAAYNYQFVIRPSPFSPPIPVTIPVPYNSSGTWTFMKSGNPNPGSVTERATFKAGTGGAANTIVASSGNTIGASDVVRLNPWGDPPANGPQTPATMQNSFQLVTLNADIMTALGAVGDVRANYFQSGSIWTANGTIPPDGKDPELRGSLYTANATMETFHQHPQVTGFAVKNCFTCHGGTAGQGITTSHIFSSIAPLK